MLLVSWPLVARRGFRRHGPTGWHDGQPAVQTRRCATGSPSGRVCTPTLCRHKRSHISRFSHTFGISRLCSLFSQTPSPPFDALCAFSDWGARWQALPTGVRASAFERSSPPEDRLDRDCLSPGKSHRSVPLASQKQCAAQSTFTACLTANSGTRSRIIPVKAELRTARIVRGTIAGADGRDRHHGHQNRPSRPRRARRTTWPVAKKGGIRNKLKS